MGTAGGADFSLPGGQFSLLEDDQKCCHILLCTGVCKVSQHPQAHIHSTDRYHRLSGEARATEHNLDCTLAWL